VLVVDDDPLVLLVTCSMLEDLSSPAKWSMLRFSF
jgi:CheY-like chemotaxis protein